MEKSAAKRNNGDGIRVRRDICTVCFVLLCIIDQIIGSAAGRMQQVAANCMGLVLAAVILTGQYRLKDFMHIYYAAWIILCGAAYVWLYRTRGELLASTDKWMLTVNAVNAAVYGCLIIRILIRTFLEKKVPQINWCFFVMWAVMMLGMVFSRNEEEWPLRFLMVFGCFYLTEYGAEELDALFTGMLNGIIAGFFIVQGFATMYRAYDTVRYNGMYTNPNMNALFYVMVQAAILGKWYQFKKKGAALQWRLLAAAGSGILFAYCFLTIGRSALIVMLINNVLMTVLLFFQEREKKIEWRILRAAVRPAAVLAAAVLSFPAVFFSVRWIPAEFYSGMKLAGDSDNKIQGWVPLYDERYVEMDEFLEYALGRIFWFHSSDEEESGAEADIEDLFGRIADFLEPSLKVKAAEKLSEPDAGEKKPWGSGLTKEDPVLSWEESGDPVKIRWAIYRTYLRRLNFLGHENDDHGVWVTESYYAPHAHNFLLQVMFCHGILTGILFLAILLCTFLHCFMRCVREKKGGWFFALGVIMVSSFVGFGTLEVDWRIGQLSFTVIFMAPYLLIQRCGRGRNLGKKRPAAKPERVRGEELQAMDAELLS